MLKKFFSFVLGLSKSSTYPTGYASGFDSPAALPAERRVSARRDWAGEISDLFEHPAWNFPVVLGMRISETPACLQSFPEAC